MVSRAARLTILDETGRPFRDAHWRDDLAALARVGRWPAADVAYWPAGDLAAGPSSGSYPARGMVVVPASTAACAGIAIGLSKDLLQRAAEVASRSAGGWCVVPRETPVTRSHLEHLLALHDAGAVVLPASPGFYARRRARPAPSSWSTSWPARCWTRSASRTPCSPAGPASCRTPAPAS